MLQDKKPIEQNGRDSFDRYRIQIKSATLQALAILQNKEIDRVYCDLHDDFVVRRKTASGYKYSFFQVKTKSKQNHNWSINELTGFKERGKATVEAEVISKSFIGKLLLHTVRFESCCWEVVFQTNLNNHDKVEALASSLECGDYTNKYAKELLERFNECFSDEDNLYSQEDIKEKLSLLKFETDVQHLKLKNNAFEMSAKEKIYYFSEIDLGHEEAKMILLKLVDMTSEKSSGVIDEYNESSIEKLAGISINDLLDVLSISKAAYDSLLKGGDDKAIKSASIIQRLLGEGGANPQQIHFLSECKAAWDNWYRNNRHSIDAFKLFAIEAVVSDFVTNQCGSDRIDFVEILSRIEDLISTLDNQKIRYDLEKEQVLGGILAEIVRRKS